MRRHDLDGFSLVFGLLFTAIGLVLLSGDPARGTMSLPWAGPIAAIAVGLVVVLAARPRREAADPQPLDIED
jgi:hypothetical protein